MFLRIGAVSVNMDQVSEIYVSPSEEQAVIRLGLNRELGFKGSEAKALVGWLDSHAANLTPATPDEQEWEEYKASIGEMDRARWEATKRELHQLNRDMNDAEPSARQMNRASELEVRLGY